MEIQNGAVVKSYMRKGFLIYEDMRKYLVIYDFATAPFQISLYIRRLWFSFLSVWTSGWTLDIPKYIFFLDEDTPQLKHMSVHNNPMFFPLRDFLRFIPCERAAQRLTTPSSCSLQHTQTNASEPVFLNAYGAQESIPRNEFRQPM
jgi:hypothetical protein